MKIIYLHQYFKTPKEGGAIRSYYLARALVKAGHEVEMITSHNQKKYIHRTIEGISVHYLPVFYANQLGFWGRIRAFFKFLWQAYQKAKTIHDAEICYATSTPLSIGLLALLLKKRQGIKYIFEVRDLWPQAPIELGFIKGKLFIKFLYYLEKKIYQNAESIVALSPGIRQSISIKVPQKEVISIPNLADTAFFQMTEQSNSSNDKFTILYTGTLGLANHLEYLLELAFYIQEKGDERFQFKIMGEGARREHLIAQAKEMNLKNLHFIANGNKDSVKETLEMAQAVYISFGDAPVLQTNSPNKFFDGLAAGKLILTNTKGWIKELVESQECGLYASPKELESVYIELISFLKNPEKLSHYQKNARKLAEDRFSLEVNLSHFLALFDTKKP